MGCYNEIDIQAYTTGDMSNLEGNQIRDHLLTCVSCRRIAESYKVIDKHLQAPLYLEPPKLIIDAVIKKLYPRYPLYSSITALIAASLLFLITWIYVYFDFANNSLIRAFSLSSKNAVNWLSRLLHTVETIYQITQAALKAISQVIYTFLHVTIDPRLIGALIVSLFLALIYFGYHRLFLSLKKEQSQ